MPRLFAAFFLVSLFAFAATAGRIDEIAAWLPEKPAADGAPASDRVKWEALAATKEGHSAIDAAGKLLGEPVPVVTDEGYLEYSRNGNRARFQAERGRLTGGFERLYQAECLEGKGRFLSKIVDYGNAICEMKSWTLPAHDGSLTCFRGNPHVDLVSAELSMKFAYCLSWLGDALPEEFRKRVYAEIDRRTFRPYLAHARGKKKINGHWWFHGGNNWNSVCNCCVVRTALAIVEDRRLRAEFVMHAEGSVPYALAGYTSDGYCSEGIGYWNYGYGHHLAMGLSLRAATGGKVDLFADQKTKAVMKYAYGFQLQNGRSPYFADGGGSPLPVLFALGRQVWPDLVSTEALNAPLLSGGVVYFPLRAFGQEPPPCEPTMDVLPPRTWFPDAQVLVARGEWPERTRRLGLAVKGGHNAELHNHNDVGSYAIMLDGEEMSGDPGGEVYTRRTFSKDRYVSKVLNSYGHPVPVVAGKLQREGRAAAAKVLKTEFTDGSDTLVLDLAAAYDAPTLKSLVRTVTFDRRVGVITVSDVVLFSEPSSFEVPVVTYREYEKDEAATHFEFKKSNRNLRRRMNLDVTASAPLAFKDEKIENPSKPDVTRLSFSSREPVADATVTMRFSAGD